MLVPTLLLYVFNGTVPMDLPFLDILYSCILLLIHFFHTFLLSFIQTFIHTKKMDLRNCYLLETELISMLRKASYSLVMHAPDGRNIILSLLVRPVQYDYHWSHVSNEHLICV